jgi:hypothetical protein
VVVTRFGFGRIFSSANRFSIGVLMSRGRRVDSVGSPFGWQSLFVSFVVALSLQVVRDGHRFGSSTRPLTWFLRKGRSLLENFPAKNVGRFGDVLLRWRQRHTLALCSSGDPLVQCFAIRHLSVPQGRVS